MEQMNSPVFCGLFYNIAPTNVVFLSRYYIKENFSLVPNYTLTLLSFLHTVSDISCFFKFQLY